MSSQKRRADFICVLCLCAASSAHAANVMVSFTNASPSNGVYLTPAWVGFHDGHFDVFSSGNSAGSALEAISEDGNAGPLVAAFAGHGTDAVVGHEPVAPGQRVSATLNVANDGSQNYFSFASMVLPSADFFIGNDNPQVVSIAGLLDGTFSSIAVDVISVFDAGTEINDFATTAGNPLFGISGGQGGPNVGADQNGVVSPVTDAAAAYAAFLNPGGDLSGLNFTDYTRVATFTLSLEPTPVPIPAAFPLMLGAVSGLGLFVRRRSFAGTT